MIKYVLFFLLLPLFSCGTYRYVNTFDSETVVMNSRAFQYEDDNLIVSYNLSNGELAFSIFNKSSQPIFLDWNLSNFILNGYSYDYYLESADFLSASNISYRGSQAEKVTFSILSKEKPVNQIPPRSRIAVAKFSIGLILFDNEDSFVRKDLRDNGFYKEEFDKKTTPLNFRNYLTYSFDKDIRNPLYVDNDFWLSRAELLNNRAFNERSPSDFTYNGHLSQLKNKEATALAVALFIPISLLILLRPFY